MTKILTDKTRPGVPKRDDVFYPESDGLPMGETGIHVDCILELLGCLRTLFFPRGRTDVHCAADMFLYYEEGNPKANKSPDVMVTFGIDGTDLRRTFKTWVEGTAPHVIFEITSDSTWKIDVYEKPLLYASLGVEEYYIFDPLDERLKPRFQGFELVDGGYRPMPIEPDGSIVSPRLAARMTPEGSRIRLFPVESSESVPMSTEFQPRLEELQFKYTQADAERSRAIERAREAAERAEEAAERAKVLEAEVARLRSLLEKQTDPDA